MSQSLVSGIILIIFGLILDGKPGMIMQAVKDYKSRESSAAFNLFARMVGGVFCLLGIFQIVISLI